MTPPTDARRRGQMHAEEVDVHDDLVGRLVVARLPHWADLPLCRMGPTGTDNAIYRLGDAYGIRLPVPGGVTAARQRLDAVLAGHEPSTGGRRG